jgi:hypothetical protein
MAPILHPYRMDSIWPLREIEKENPIKPPRYKLKHRLKPLFKTPVLCQVCRSRKLDFRPLKVKPPSSIRGIPDPDELEDMEGRHVVHIYDFSLEEAKARRFECSLCRLLYCCAFAADVDEHLVNRRFVCTLQPRYGWLAHDNIKGRIVHKQQIWVRFQLIETEALLDMVDVNQLKPTRGARTPIPARIDLKLLKHWLRECDTKHSHPTTISGALRSRIQSILSRGLFRVINTSTGSVEVPTSLPRFVALSYVWGQNAVQSKNRPVEGGPVKDYAPTIRDAAVIARAVGYEWLWVDQICIDQNSTSEKACLIPYMKDIYGAAELTIVAACADSVQTGLLGSPDTPRKAEKPIVLDSSFALLHVAMSCVSLIGKTAWDRRGWTFQEHMFSRRLLFVFSSEAVLECTECYFRESRGRRSLLFNYPEPKRRVYDDGHVSRTTEFRFILHNPLYRMETGDGARTFIGALADYTYRNLSVEADRVSAFAGVLLTASASPVDQAAVLKHGHPLRFFEILLTWQKGVFSKEPAPLPDKPFVPSWSWASSTATMGVGFELMYSQISLNQVCWYEYESLQNHDVLGLPAAGNEISLLIGLSLPDGLMVDQPWVESTSDALPLDYRAGPSTEAPTHDSLSLPKLHLVTLVFDAHFVYRGSRDGVRKRSHVLLPLGSNKITDDAEKWTRCEWSIPPQLQSGFTCEGIDSRPQPFETFAIITGHRCRSIHEWPDEAHYDLYIMLLDTVGPNTYSRLGLAQLQNVHAHSYTAEVIKKGRPRWQYIRII